MVGIGLQEFFRNAHMENNIKCSIFYEIYIEKKTEKIEVDDI